MAKITKKNLEAKLSMVRQNTGLDLMIEFSGSPRKPRVFMDKGNGVLKELSPRMPVKDIYEWLDAFDIGYTLGYCGSIKEGGK